MIWNVQALRALAAVLVVFVHLSGLLGTLGLPGFGAGGVDLFFVISGFVMVHTTRFRPPTPTAFFYNRVARIVPIYWLGTLVVFIASVAMPRIVRDVDDYTLMNLIKSLVFIPYEKSNGIQRPILFVSWTLNYEMFFYCIFSFIIAIIGWFGAAPSRSIVELLHQSIHSGIRVWNGNKPLGPNASQGGWNLAQAVCAGLRRLPARACCSPASLA